ncbi:hypothetical protein TRM7557_01586 [Tritonibacter multivorans]|uniref:Uncharacterized protein n=1 Tax=Tritonibacter multivorans TaxID=928856 RepID=A0A0P1GT91_9RHOB|nr:nucleotidyltransferase family protein [Tritonibacter multivorans]MDA7422265.1 nucleotidyltransferase family protein [Tritonibacter multivorans]CUH77792.1 hypothetical protein TRM7557_01586 [Tritonibacter multivorans]SFD11605.1 Uncharacterised nucleotidyltransferase [Tritonibacter multivorans]
MGRSATERLAACLNGDFSGNLDWFELVNTANEHFVAAFLSRSLAASDVQADADAEAYLETLETATRSRNRQMWTLTCEVVAALNAAGIVPALIKGASDMAARSDPAGFPRVMIDIDMILAPEDLAKGQEVLAEMGFAALEDSEDAHSPGSFWRQGAVASLDMHASLPRRISVLLDEEDWNLPPSGGLGAPSRLQLVTRDGARMWVPDASLRFLINISHDMLHHTALISGASNLRYLLVLAAQMQEEDAPLDWAWLRAKAAHPRFALALDLQLLMLAHLFGLRGPWPLPQGRLQQALHQRRLWKMRFPGLGRAEWACLQVGQRLSRPLRHMIWPPGRNPSVSRCI